MDTILYLHSKEETSASELLASVRDVADRVHLHVQTIDFIPKAEQVSALVDCWRPSGVIVECGGFAASLPPKAFSPLPVVFLDVDPRSLPPSTLAVFHDSRETGVLAAKELLMTGHRHFAFIDSPVRTHWGDERCRYFLQTLKVNGHTASIFRPRKNAENDKVAYQHALRDFIARLPPQSAIFAATDTVGTDVIGYSMQLGREIPSDLVVIGVDDSEGIFTHTAPRLSSIRLDFRGGGTIAALMLLAAMRAKGRFVGARHRTFGTLNVVRRASTQFLHKSDPRVLAALDTIHREACSGITSSAVAKRHFACSRQLAERIFKLATGHTILQEIHEVQLNRAKLFLANRSQQLKHISDFCGFSNPNSLRKFFLRETGMTMSQWRAAHDPTAKNS